MERYLLLLWLVACSVAMSARISMHQYNNLVNELNAQELERAAEVKNVWLEHNVSQNGEKGIRIHAHLVVRGMKGKDINVIAYFYDENKNRLKGSVAGYYASDGQVCASRIGRPGYVDCTFQDFDIFIPLRAIPLAEGRHNYYCGIMVYDVEQQKFLCPSSNYVMFVGTGYANDNNHQVPNPSNNNARVPENQSLYFKDGHVCKSVSFFYVRGENRATIDGDQNDVPLDITTYYLYEGTNNGYMCFAGYSQSLRPQVKKQMFLGREISTIDGSLPPPERNGRVMKISCDYKTCIYRNVVYQQATRAEYDAYERMKQRSLDELNRKIQSNGGSDDGNEPGASGKRKQTGSKGCSRCNGTGVELSPNSGGGLTAWVAYYHSRGSKCRYCGDYSEHFHNRCSSCNVPSY